jgi:hypothetical protein
VRYSKNFYPRLLLAEYLGDQRVRLSFSAGGFVEVKVVTLPSATRDARIVDSGLGLDPGDGFDRSATTLYTMRGEWLRKRPDHPEVMAAFKSAMQALRA